MQLSAAGYVYLFGSSAPLTLVSPLKRYMLSRWHCCSEGHPVVCHSMQKDVKQWNSHIASLDAGISHIEV